MLTFYGQSYTLKLKFLSFTCRTGIASLLTNFLGGGVHVGVFVLQFIEWWYDENNESSIKQVMKQPIPDPPTSVIQKSKIPVPKAGVCPLCNRYFVYFKVMLLICI